MEKYITGGKLNKAQTREKKPSFPLKPSEGNVRRKTPPPHLGGEKKKGGLWTQKSQGGFKPEKEEMGGSLNERLIGTQ